MFEEYLTLWHLKMLIIYIVANCALPWYTIWKNKRLKPVEGRETEKFAPWVRNDMNEWSYVRCIFTHFFFIIRYCMLLGILFLCLIGILILSIGASIDNLSQTRKWLITEWTCVCMRLFCPIFGVVYFTKERPKVDYRKWLGPDWKPTYEGATMLVSNHQSWYDVFMTYLFIRPMPGFIAKASVKGIPAIGAAATSIGSMFLNRADKARRSEIFDLIKERQELCEQGKAGPLLVFPEGCSTNGKYIIKFKKGAFANLKPIKPMVVNAPCLVGNNCRGDLMGIWQWSFLIPFMNIFLWPKQQELPVFAPNEYFWKNHWDGKNEEDKWEIFANAVREVMAEAGGFKLSDSTQEDKVAYKKLVWGGAFKED